MRRNATILTTAFGAALAISAVIVRLEPIVTIAILVATAAALLLVVYPSLGLLFYVSCMGFIDPVAEVIGLPPGMRAFPFAVTLALLLVTHVVVTGKAVKLRSMYLGPIAILLLLIAGLAWTPAPYYGAYKVQAYIQYNLFAFLGTSLFVGDRKRLEQLVYVSVWLAPLLLVLSGINVMVAGEGAWQRFEWVGFTPIGLGRVMGFSAVSLLVVSRVVESRYARALCVGMIPALLFIVFLTGSRMPLFAVVGTVLAYLIVMEKGSVWRRVALIAVFVGASYGTFLLAPEGAQTRYTGLFGEDDYETNPDASDSRARLYDVAIEAITHYPLVGLGTGGFAWWYTGGVDTRGGYPHNLILELLSEFGSLGLIALVWFFAPSVRIVWKLARERAGVTRDNFLVCWGALVLLLGVFNAMTSGDITHNFIVWFAAAFLQTADYTVRRERPAAEGRGRAAASVRA